MTKITHIHQFHALRQLKFDQMLAKVQRIQSQFLQAKAEYENASRDYQTIVDRQLSDFGSLLDKVVHITDPQSRLDAVNQTLTHQTLAKHSALNRRQTAEDAVRAMRIPLRLANEELTTARAQLSGAQTLLEKELYDLQILADERADEEALDQFGAIR